MSNATSETTFLNKNEVPDDLATEMSASGATFLPAGTSWYWLRLMFTPVSVRLFAALKGYTAQKSVAPSDTVPLIVAVLPLAFQTVNSLGSDLIPSKTATFSPLLHRTLRPSSQALVPASSSWTVNSMAFIPSREGTGSRTASFAQAAVSIKVTAAAINNADLFIRLPFIFR